MGGVADFPIATLLDFVLLVRWFGDGFRVCNPDQDVHANILYDMLEINMFRDLFQPFVQAFLLEHYKRGTIF